MSDPFQEITDRLDRGDERFKQIDDKLNCLPQLQTDMAVVREILEALQGLKTLGRMLTAIAKPILAAGAMIGMAWGAFKLAIMAATKGG